MEFKNYLNEDKVSKALDLPEPEIGNDYAPEKVKRYIEIIDDALEEMQGEEENDANDAIVQDLRDKKEKWTNVDSETKPKKTKTEVPPEEEGGEPPPEEEKNESAVLGKINKYVQ